MAQCSGLMVVALLMSVLAAGAIATPARADQLFVQQSGSAPAGGGPNIITSTTAFSVGVAGSATLQDPLLVIVGVYDGMGTPSISFGGCPAPGACPAATAGTYGLTAATAKFTSGSAFGRLGLSSGGSESFVNWSGGDTAAGFAAPTSFSLYAFELNTSLTGGSPITIDESGAANGSYIIAYDCKARTGKSSGCAKNGDISQTVFTNTGLVDAGSSSPRSVPEPGSLLLLTTGLIGLGFLGGLGRRPAV